MSVEYFHTARRHGELQRHHRFQQSSTQSKLNVALEHFFLLRSKACQNLVHSYFLTKGDQDFLAGLEVGTDLCSDAAISKRLLIRNHNSPCQP